jgi:uncharacterized phage-associated protein
MSRLTSSKRWPDHRALKLQKLLYYSQAWHLVWEDTPLFTARIEAWIDGRLFRRSISATAVNSKYRSGRVATLMLWDGESAEL